MVRTAAFTTFEPVDPAARVVLSANAEHSIAIRNLDPDQILSFVRNASPAEITVDPGNGLRVYRDGNLRIVVKKDDDTLVVLTTIEDDELTPLNAK